MKYNRDKAIMKQHIINNIIILSFMLEEYIIDAKM
jgi:hypothetical protein